MMIVAASMTLHQVISDLSCLSTQPASYAVFKLKLFFTVSVLHALAMHIAQLCVLRTFTARQEHTTGRQKT